MGAAKCHPNTRQSPSCLGARGSVAICHVAGQANARALQDRAGALGPGLYAAECDVADPASVKRFAGWALERLGQVDIVVNSASVGDADRPFSMTGDDDWDRIIRVNVRGTIQVTRSFFGALLARKQGWVINIAS